VALEAAAHTAADLWKAAVALLVLQKHAQCGGLQTQCIDVLWVGAEQPGNDLQRFVELLRLSCRIAARVSATRLTDTNSDSSEGQW
jgi:hypothetical protein